MTADFATADLIDLAPDTPSCETDFKSYGRRRRFCGRIRTIRCHQDNGLIKALMNTPGNGQVLVVDGGGSRYSALMGDMIADAARQNGWAGAVIFGVIRDSVAIDQMDFGIKALGTNPKKSGKSGVGESDVSVSFGNLTFTPGHYLYSDEDGILVSPEPIEAA
ncbi:ribonuclease E activity regulator RraA [Neisseria shayeganii]|uniref:4-hydroxy-4-methyl-2-oxoglutarate aldolase n=1 Tax=Neisseria shayeganii 871 TaxID=1032488 RepID=G4CFY2_9NEIS|nr:ribonuclease E activity regulator RraA [Neisseria shayeganii]EGY53223.1 S-adenosylmethionine:2-demethylmenaquinone methyltransferase [Neisseria shayeganii 871]